MVSRGAGLADDNEIVAGLMKDAPDSLPTVLAQARVAGLSDAVARRADAGVGDAATFALKSEGPTLHAADARRLPATPLETAWTRFKLT